MFCIFISANNLALQRPAYQSSEMKGRSASRAVDGDKNTNAEEQQSCSCTNLQKDPWFLVVLDRSYVIHSVELTNRGDYVSKYNTIRIHAKILRRILRF